TEGHHERGLHHCLSPWLFTQQALVGPSLYTRRPRLATKVCVPLPSPIERIRDAAGAPSPRDRQRRRAGGARPGREGAPPAAQLPRRQTRAAVAPAHRHLEHAAEARHRDRATHAVLAARRIDALAELPLVEETPAVGLALAVARAGVVLGGGELDHL